ncbi:MAG TPA: DUF4430 domain-containing protein [Patescibacteria group bacterium]|nr:DUF4430 domain-containing protein [Patescibacteria group bacterium]
MRKYSKLIPLLIFLAVVGVWFFSGKAPGQEASRQTESQDIRTNLSVDTGTGTASFDISNFIGKTALEATQANIETEISGQGEGAFVISIDKRTADAGKREFWEFIVNGKSAEVGAGSYIIQNGDQIKWQINTY